MKKINELTTSEKTILDFCFCLADTEELAKKMCEDMEVDFQDVLDTEDLHGALNSTLEYVWEK